MGTRGTSRNGIPRGTGAYASAHRQKRRWFAVLGVLAALVVFVTVYALMTPAATLTADGAEETTEEVMETDGEEVATDEEAEVEQASVTTEEAEVAETVAETGDVVVEDEAETVAAAALPDGAQVPDGYTEQYSFQDEANGVAVTVYAPEGVVPEGATLSVALLSEDDAAYAEAEEALAADDDYGFAALDIHFEVDGEEVEPSGDVYVVIDAEGLLPEDVDPESVTVQHHAESDGSVTVETVADVADETDGVVAVADDTTVQAAFEVSGFSTFTVSWNGFGSSDSVETTEDSGESVEVLADIPTTLDTSITITSSGTGNASNHNWTVSETGIVSLSNASRQTVTVTALNEGTVTLTHTYQSGRTNYTENYYIVVDSDDSSNLNVNAYVKVYVYVAGKYISDDCLTLLGIDGKTLDQSGYFPAGEIYLNVNYFSSLSTAAGVGLINSEQDWEELLEALSEMDTTTLIDQTNFDYSGLYDAYKVDYTLNRNNYVGDYLPQADIAFNQEWGSQYTALFHWHYDSSGAGCGHYGFADQSVQYHLDLHFSTKTIKFVYGNNGITSGSAQDLTEASRLTYITGSEVQEPTIAIPDGYYFAGYYTDANFTTPWDGIGDPLYSDETVYIRLVNKQVMTLSISKEIAWDEDTNSTSVENKEYSFTISTTDSSVAGKTYTTSTGSVTFSSEQNASGFYTAVVTLRATTQNGVDGYIAIYELPAHNDSGQDIEYTVTENDTNVGIDGYTLESVTYSKTINGVTSEGNIVNASGQDSTASSNVQVTNTYKQVEAVDITVTKVDSQDMDKVLSNAEFYLTNADGNYYKYDEDTETVSWVNGADAATKFTSGEDGTFSIFKLEDGIYSLVETKAPDGYQLTDTQITITVSGGKITCSVPNYDGNSITVTNTTGAKLPETGGTGTTMFTIGGVALVAAAGCGYGLMRRRERRG